MQRLWLGLRLTGPLASFGAPAVDHIGPTFPFPARSALAGLIANALGYRASDPGPIQRLEDGIRAAHAALRPGSLLRDAQNAQLDGKDRGWTWSGVPEGRKGSSYGSPHRRFREYMADSCILTALTLEGAGVPSLGDVAHALDFPARPLFIGRKPCLPSMPVLLRPPLRLFRSETAFHAVSALAGSRCVPAQWPEDDGPAPEGSDSTVFIPETKAWKCGYHKGRTAVVRGMTRPSGLASGAD